MLAEIFMLRLEAGGRSSQALVPGDARFVPFYPASGVEFKDTSKSRRSKDV
jgi:hypothetical protein